MWEGVRYLRGRAGLKAGCHRFSGNVDHIQAGKMAPPPAWGARTTLCHRTRWVNRPGNRQIMSGTSSPL
jgi:hypothetical protein